MDEVAKQLKVIFADAGVPAILHMDNGKEFKNQTVEKVVKDYNDLIKGLDWPECKIVHGKPRHSQSQGSVERSNRDVQNILKAEMKDRNHRKWSELLPIVQFKKNNRLHAGIGRTPFVATYGDVRPVAIDNLRLPTQVAETVAVTVTSEEQLDDLLKNRVGDEAYPVETVPYDDQLGAEDEELNENPIENPNDANGNENENPNDENDENAMVEALGGNMSFVEAIAEATEYLHDLQHRTEDQGPPLEQLVSGELCLGCSKMVAIAEAITCSRCSKPSHAACLQHVVQSCC